MNLETEIENLQVLIMTESQEIGVWKKKLHDKCDEFNTIVEQNNENISKMRFKSCKEKEALEKQISTLIEEKMKFQSEPESVTCCQCKVIKSMNNDIETLKKQMNFLYYRLQFNSS